MARTRGETVIAIDLLRCVAAGLVVLHHFGAALPMAPGWQVAAVLNGVRLPAGAAAWTWWGWIGVPIFFVISGQVIAASAEDADATTFLKRRAWRLAPAVWLCASLTAMALKLAHPNLAVALPWAKAVLMLPTLDGVDQSYWTLSIEWAFYALVALVLTGGGERRRLEVLATGLGLASATFWAVSPLLPQGLAGNLGFQMTLLPHGCFFALGALLGRRRPALVAVLLMACGAEIVYHTGAISRVLGLTVTPAMPLLVFAGAVMLLADRRSQPRLIRVIGEHAAARAAAVTYPLYLLHQVAGAAVAAMLIRAGVPPIAAVALAIGAAMAAACIVAWSAEPTVRRLRRRRDPVADNPPTAFLRAG